MSEFTAKQTHSGQYRAYGDSFRVWEIQTDSTDEKEVLEYCFTTLYKRRVPEHAEWSRNTGNADCYFGGYYTLQRITGGYKFTICEPYTD
jgi:hypothetical protein